MKSLVFIALFALFAFSACSPPRPLPSPTAIPSVTATPTTTDLPTLEPTATDLPSPTPSQAAGTLTPVTYEHSPRAILIEADISSTKAIPRDLHLVTYRLYGDGLVVFAGDPTAAGTGLDSVVRVGHLTESEIQTLLAFVTQSGFFNLSATYQPRPLPADAMSSSISVYLGRAKTVRVYAPDSDSTPAVFKTVLERILQTIPSDALDFVPSDAFLQATPAGAIGELGQGTVIGEWSNVSTRLADAVDGISVSGIAYRQIVALYARQDTSGLYREGDRVYRVRFAPNVPRAVHLTDWLGAILDSTREFGGRVFDIVGYYRGANLFGEVRDTAPNVRNAWVLADASGAMYVAGIAPSALNPNSRADAWTVVRVRGTAVYVRLGTSYIQAQRVEVVSSSAPSAPTPPPALSPSPSPPSSSLIANADAAIALAKSRFTEVARIQKAGAGIIGASHTCPGGQCQGNIFVIERPDGWDLAFWEGSGDCPAGCINNHYNYFSVKKDGRVSKVGEYGRTYNWVTNSFDIAGAPMWGVPK